MLIHLSTPLFFAVFILFFKIVAGLETTAIDEDSEDEIQEIEKEVLPRTKASPNEAFATKGKKKSKTLSAQPELANAFQFMQTLNVHSERKRLADTHLVSVHLTRPWHLSFYPFSKQISRYCTYFFSV